MSTAPSFNQVILPAPGEAAIDDGVASPATLARFCLTCVADHVYLRLADGEEPVPRLLPMASPSAGRWELTLPLRPGLYRYR